MSAAIGAPKHAPAIAASPKRRFKETVRAMLPRGLHRHAILTGDLRGYRIYTSWHDYPGAILGRTEKSLLRWFAANAATGDTWLDVGAHYGYTAIALSRLTGSGGRVFAFEPVLATAGCVAQTRLLNRLDQLQVVPFGLSASPELRPVRLAVSRGMADSVITAAGLKTSWEEVIYTVAFDMLWKSLSVGNSRVDGVKIDVQGMEGQVLAGMRKLLETQRPKLAIEFHSGVERDPILGLLESCGYSPEGFSIDTNERVRSSAGLMDDRSYAFYSRRSG